MMIEYTDIWLEYAFKIYSVHIAFIFFNNCESRKYDTYNISSVFNKC